MPSFEGDLSEQEIRDVATFVSGGEGARQQPPSPRSSRSSPTPSGSRDVSTPTAAGRQGNIAYREGPKPALALFAEKLSDDAVGADCHRIAHTIGAASLQHYDGNVGKALAEGNAICASGYYHGLLEWKLAGVPKAEVASVARTVCDQTKSASSSFVYYQCVHGLGHGLMLYTLYDLPGALRLCHRLGTDFDRVSCSGVFMENQQSSYGITSPWLEKDDLLYPCGIVSRSDKTYCYLLVTSRILPSRRLGLEEDRRLVPKERAGLRRAVLPVVRTRRVRELAAGSRQGADLCANAGSGEEEQHLRGARHPQHRSVRTSAPPDLASWRSPHTGPTVRTGSARSSPSNTAPRTRSGPTAGGSCPASTTSTACAARTPSRT